MSRLVADRDVHLFDADDRSEARSGRGVTPRRRTNAVGRRGASVLRRRRTADLLCCRRCSIFGVFVFYPFFKNFQPRFFTSPPFPGLPDRSATSA